MHPRSKHWHQLDLIVARQDQLNNIRIARSFHSADCNNDHSLVCSKVQLHQKKLHRAQNPAKAHINVVATLIKGKVLAFRELLQTKQEKYHALGTEDQMQMQQSRPPLWRTRT